MKAKDILAEKGTRVVTIHKDNLLVDVMSHFLVNRVGSLVVVNKYDEIMGIVAPVDVLEAVHKDPVNISTMTVREVMSENVIVAGPDESVETLMAIMTENHTRSTPSSSAAGIGTWTRRARTPCSCGSAARRRVLHIIEQVASVVDFGL